MGSQGNLEHLRPGAKRLPRFNRGGNFCDHCPDKPSFRKTVQHLANQASHPLLRHAILRMGRYYHDTRLLQSIDRILGSGDFRTKNKNGGYRKVRSERRDAIAIVFAYALSEMSLMKLQVGKVPYSDFKGLLADTYEDIANKVGLSLIRVKRAFQHIKNAGYISITPRRIKQEDGSFKSLSAVIRIQECVFSLLGVSKEWLERARQHQYSKWKKERLRRFDKAVQKQTERKHAESVSDYLFHQAQMQGNDLLNDIMDTVSRFPSKSKRWRSQQSKNHR
ncbi:MAG: hypothetical protein MI976_11320 [Pseudomonadales bacterium]|nr:hypothetical protein [Pseudomonadales bacterium]